MIQTIIGGLKCKFSISYQPMKKKFLLCVLCDHHAYNCHQMKRKLLYMCQQERYVVWSVKTAFWYVYLHILGNQKRNKWRYSPVCAVSIDDLTLLHSELPKLHRILAVKCNRVKCLDFFIIFLHVLLHQSIVSLNSPHIMTYFWIPVCIIIFCFCLCKCHMYMHIIQIK